MTAPSVLILGGSGNFGRRIAENLRHRSDTKLLLAARDRAKAARVAHSLERDAAATIEATALDIDSPDLGAELKGLAPDLVIHTAGPFQGRDYRVARTCIQAGLPYVDLADARAFVAGFSELDAAARARGVLAVSGASTVPGLSATVIDHYRSRFGTIRSLDIAIAPGNRAEVGEATLRGILSYTGHPFRTFRDGGWQDAYGWMEPRREDFGGRLGRRWLANVDVPDLGLFPARYGVTETVRFQAGLELPPLHLTMVAMAGLARAGLVGSWAPLTRPMLRAHRLFHPFGTDHGGMRVAITGTDPQGQPLSVRWHLYADHGVGPYIPTLCATIVAEKLLRGELTATGAMPCTGLCSLGDFQPHAERLGLYWTETWDG